MWVGGTNNMRNPLDLNNFPDDNFTRSDQLGKQTLDHHHHSSNSSASASGGIYRKKKNGAKDVDESGKVYECRFCSLKFFKSQALGGHMNRHRQERETEALNQARQLVFSNDNILPPLLPHQLPAGGQSLVHGGFHHQAAACNMSNTISMYPTKLFSDMTSTTMLPPPNMYTSPVSRLNHPYSSQYPPLNDYFMGHVCSGNAPPFTLQNLNAATAPPPESANNYTCIGAPLGQSFTLSEGSGGGKEMSQSLVNYTI